MWQEFDKKSEESLVDTEGDDNLDDLDNDEENESDNPHSTRKNNLMKN